jgi:CheY-like chemotaxis protein
MDIQMPVLNGYEASKAIRQLDDSAASRVPIIAMTAHAMNSSKHACTDAGMDDFISKPVNMNILVQKLKQWLPQQAANRRLEESGGE